MNYYHRHLGDYAKDTTNLSALEHGVYNLILDRYYSTERGIPADQVYRIAKAVTRSERKAVDFVLGEFFKLRSGVWTSKRCDEEIVRAQAKIAAAKANGAKGGRPKITQQEPSGFQLANPDESSPISSLQSPRNKNPEGAKSAHGEEFRADLRRLTEKQRLVVARSKT